ncbi:uncharacterized protein LOC113232637 [Hyposmocoma kahamanoa]|uniref:uncharacterized protein LOC113232637 n=1 Tax=Hyposmocoma kahamanoa TaxID=1477025 RepID=UPI000E6D89DC|nr:uncharacterized protein LOC113232637 [Hyposmocoma kahamanoa]
MERNVLGVKRTERIRNTTLRSQTQIADVAQKAAKLKWRWAGHVCCTPEDLWAEVTIQWSPKSVGHRGRPRKGWRDELDAYDKAWVQLAQDRDAWRDQEEAFAQQWDTSG